MLAGSDVVTVNGWLPPANPAEPLVDAFGLTDGLELGCVVGPVVGLVVGRLLGLVGGLGPGCVEELSVGWVLVLVG